MFDDDQKAEIILPSLPVLDRPEPKYTHKTPAFVPLVTSVFRTGAVMGIEWVTLRYIENVPDLVAITTFIICLCILAVLEWKDWLNFKRRGLFITCLMFLILLYASISAYAFIYLRAPPETNPAITELQTKFAAALRERDIAISERDEARREHGEVTPDPSLVPLPPSMKASEIDARLDAWKGVEAQMNDLDRILSEGDEIIRNWKNYDRQSLMTKISVFRQESTIVYQRLNNLLGANSDFSDLKAIDGNAMRKLQIFNQNLLDAINQTLQDASKDELQTSVAPYIGPVEREIASLKNWLQTTKHVAESSALELTSRQQAGK